MKNFIKEFKVFISRGNVIDMAVGIIIGGAFKGIVDSLVNDVINPLIGIICGKNFDQLSVNLLGEATLSYGKFMTAVINFLIMAFVIFCFIKLLNRMSRGFKKKEEEPQPATTKKCPYCVSEIAIEAVRCPHCTSELAGDDR